MTSRGLQMIPALLLLACSSEGRSGVDTFHESHAGTDSSPGDSTPGAVDSDTSGESGGNRPEVDDDGDGYTEQQGDCDDEHAGVNPGVPEDCETWANDNCRGGANEDCVGWAWRQWEISYEWAGGEVTAASETTRVIGVRLDEVLCEVVGTPVARKDPAAACPECLWTFYPEEELFEEFRTGDCSGFIEWWPDVQHALGPAMPVGFTPVNPEDGSRSDIGWIVRDPAVVDGDWLLTAGPGRDWVEYTFGWDESGGSAFARSRNYYFYYYYYPYGEPNRDHNP